MIDQKELNVYSPLGYSAAASTTAKPALSLKLQSRMWHSNRKTKIIYFTVYLLGGSVIIRVNSVIHVSLKLKLKMVTFRLKLYCS